MTETERFLSLLKEFGQLLGIQELKLDNQDGCCLSFDDQVVNLHYLPEKESVVLLSDLGNVPEARREALYREMLAANFYREDMARSVLSYVTATDSVVLILSQPVREMSLKQLENTVERFVNIAMIWAQRIREFSKSNAEAPNEQPASTDLPVQPHLLA